MDEDFYIENNSVGKILFLIVLFLGLIGGGYYFYKNYFLKSYVKLNKVNVELGSLLSQDIHEYIECSNYEDYELDLSNVKIDDKGNVVSPGEYSYKIVDNNNYERKGKIYVKDTTLPKVAVQELTVGVNEKYDVADFVTSCEDYSLPCKVDYKNHSDIEINKSAGNYSFNIVIADAFGNEVIKKVKLIVKEGYSYTDVKKSDLNVSYISNQESNWNNTYTVKYEKAFDVDDHAFDEKLKELSAVEYDFEKNILDKELILIYNKYNYVIGVSVKVTFEDNEVLFVTTENAKIKELDTETEEVE